jgi:acyl carrier protein
LKNRPNERELKKIIGEFIEDQLNISINEDSPLGEKLDSLNRLALIEFLSDKYATDFSEILIDPKVWVSIESMCKSSIYIIGESDTASA